jgi:two-component system response regulator HydG
MAVAPTILVIDDEKVVRDSCRQVLSRDGYNIEVAEDGREGLEKMKGAVFDIVILDLKLPGLSGMDVLKKIKGDDPDAIVIVITGHGTIESAVESMKLGAYDFIPKPFTPDVIRAIVKRGIEKNRLALENAALKDELKSNIGTITLVGNSKPMQHIDELIKKVGPTDSTVLICGESGTGKELVARALHLNSSRRDKSFVVVDCGTLVENLFESELFGHHKGSFTGATSVKYGRFELANGGTIFFDEIGNVSTNVQAKLLRAVQEREISRVGSAQVIKIDVRIIAATNKDLMQMVKNETFREDLFYRLNVVPIELPPLRERKDDIVLLAGHFLKKYNKERKKNILSISNAAMKGLARYDWPGNVRELENAIERAVVLAKGNVIEPHDLFYHDLTFDDNKDFMEMSLADIEKKHVLKVLKALGGNKIKTAEILGIDRKTLREKIRKYKIAD